MTSKNDTKPVLYYDGYCNLCNGAVQFVLRHESTPDILFASLQSETGRAMTALYDLQQIDSLVFVKNDRVHVKSDAAMEIARYLKSPFRAVRLFRFIPRQCRDFVYDLVAKYRYKIFGRSLTCRLPNKDEKERFLDI